MRLPTQPAPPQVVAAAGGENGSHQKDWWARPFPRHRAPLIHLQVDSETGDVVSKGNLWSTLAGTGLQGSILSGMLAIGEGQHLTKPYLENVIAYACMRAKAQALSATPLRVYESADQDAEAVDDGEIVRLFARPNLLDAAMDFWERMSLYSDLAGGALLVMVKLAPDGKPSAVAAQGPIRPGVKRVEMPDEVWPIRFDLVSYSVDPETGAPIAWKYASRGEVGRQEFPDHAVVRVVSIDPDDPLSAQGPSQAAFRALNRAYILETYTQALLENSGDPGGILSSETSPTREQRQELEKSWTDNYGGFRNARKTAILPGGLEYKPIGFAPKDMEFQALDERDVQRICAAYGVPKSVLGLDRVGGLGDHGTATKADQEWFWKQTLIPIQTRWENQLNTRMIARLDLGRETGRVVRFDRSGIEALREDRTARLDRVKKWWDMGVHLAEAARLEDVALEQPVEGADIGYVPGTVREVGSEPLGAQPPAPAAKQAESAEETPTVVALSGGEEADHSEVSPDEFERVVTGLTDRAMRFEYVEKVFRGQQQRENAFARKAERVFEERLLAVRKKLRELAVTGKPRGKSAGADGDAVDVQESPACRMSDESAEECVARKVPEIMHEDPDMDQAQAVAIAHSLCEHSCSDKGIDEKAWRDGARTRRLPLIRKRVTKAELDRILGANEERWAKLLWERTAPALKAAFVAAAEGQARELHVSPFVDSASPEVLRFVRSREVLIKESVEEVREQIRRVLVAGLDEASTVGTLSDRVLEVLKELEGKLQQMKIGLPARAQMIARTEVAGATNEARVAQMETSGITHHEWITSKNESVREGHRIDGEVREIGATFSNGMLAPGNDPKGRPGMVINERCLTTAVRKRAAA